MATLTERCNQRQLVKAGIRFYPYRGKEHDLYIALPDYADLQRCFEIIFDAQGIEPPVIVFRKKRYVLAEPPLLSEDRGYYCIQGKFKGSKGLHKIPLHRLAYTAFYGQPPVGYHIHHIDRDKHNNAAINLVALTEGEHCTVHQRDVSVPRNMFTKPKPKGLLVNMPQQQQPQDAAKELFRFLLSSTDMIPVDKFIDWCKQKGYILDTQKNYETVLDVLVSTYKKEQHL
ncbi:MAG: HNH endonuclease [Acetobacter sp.]|nr:HNH endonuclease [Acetobacter sp.]